MNLPIFILLFFALLGAVDKLLDNRFGLAEEFDKGLTMMGSLALSMGGVYCFSIMLGEILSVKMAGVSFPFDPSLLISSVLAPDMGAYSISAQLVRNPSILLFSGVVLSSTLGTTISFALPIALSSTNRESTANLMGGMVYGITMIPLALIVCGLSARIPLPLFLRNFFPIVCLCGFLCLAIFKAKNITTKVFLLIGNLIRWLSILLFLLIIWQVFAGNVEFVRFELIQEIFVIVFKITIITCGSFILSKLVLKYFMRYIMGLAGVLRINEFAVVGLILSLVTSVSMFSVFDKMDRRGQIINAAFSVSAAFVFGGQLAFISTVEPNSIAPYILSKLAGGIAALLIASYASRNILCPVESTPS